MTISEAARQMRAGRLSATELAGQAFTRIAERNAELGAFISIADEGDTLRRAAALDDELAAGNDRGLLHGIPVAVKDLLFTRALPTTFGSKLLTAHHPQSDATVMERLEAAGAVLVGKTNLHEFAYGITSQNPHFGPVKNPVDPARIPGGSSGGSAAAVAAGMAFLAIGTDTGGSIRIPAAFCGITGIKPTFGLVSRHGCFALGLTLDHIGPMASTVRDAAIGLQAIAGFDARDDASVAAQPQNLLPPDEVSLAGLRLGWPENFFFDRVEPAVQHAVEAAAQAAVRKGAELIKVRVPRMATLNAIARVTLLAEAAAMLGEFHKNHRDDIGADVRALLDQGSLLPATAYIDAQRARRRFIREFAELFSGIDCLIAPTAPVTAPRVGDRTMLVAGENEDVRLASTRLVRGINPIGLPALSLPCGVALDGLPVGAQLIARPLEDGLLLRFGAAIEDELANASMAPAAGRIDAVIT